MYTAKHQAETKKISTNHSIFPNSKNTLSNFQKTISVVSMDQPTKLMDLQPEDKNQKEQKDLIII